MYSREVKLAWRRPGWAECCPDAGAGPGNRAGVQRLTGLGLGRWNAHEQRSFRGNVLSPAKINVYHKSGRLRVRKRRMVVETRRAPENRGFGGRLESEGGMCWGGGSTHTGTWFGSDEYSSGPEVRTIPERGFGRGAPVQSHESAPTSGRRLAARSPALVR